MRDTVKRAKTQCSRELRGSCWKMGVIGDDPCEAVPVGESGARAGSKFGTLFSFGAGDVTSGDGTFIDGRDALKAPPD
jgi:hypothetical protein